jgi:hypothetical protein
MGVSGGKKQSNDLYLKEKYLKVSNYLMNANLEMLLIYVLSSYNEYAGNLI